MKIFLSSIFFCFIIISGITFSQDLAEFEECNIQVGGKIDKVLIIDVNGDNFSEIVYQKGMNVFILFYQKQSAVRFSIKNCSIIHLKPDDVLWCFGDVALGQEQELVTITPYGVDYYSIVENGQIVEQVKDYKNLIKCPTVFRARVTEASDRTIENPVYKEFALDANNDKLTDIVIPDFNKYIFYTQGAERKFNLNQRIFIESDAHLQVWGEFLHRMSYALSFPRFYFRDFDCDGKNDFLMFKGNILYVYPCNKDGTINAIPTNEITVDIKDRAKMKKIKKRKYMRYEFDIPPFINDINKDGSVDIVLSNVSKGRCIIFLGEKSTKETYDEPDQIIELDGWLISQFFKDVNGDGRLDLLLVRVPKLGFWEIINVFAAKAIDIEGLVLLNRPDGLYGMQTLGGSDFKKDISIPFALSFSSAELLKVTSSFIIDLADLNGDACTDFFMKTGDRELTVYKGTKDGKIGTAFNKKINLKLDTSVFANSTTYISDINRDGVSDIVIWHSDFHDASNFIEILISKK